MENNSIISHFTDSMRLRSYICVSYCLIAIKRVQPHSIKKNSAKKRIQVITIEWKAVYLINKSSSKAGTEQVEANLQEHLNDHLHFRKRKMVLEYVVLKAIFSRCFAPALTLSEILTFQIVYLEM